MFDWFKAEEIPVSPTVTKVGDCSKEYEIELLKKRLQQSESDYQSLKQEIEQQYVKDTERIDDYNSLELFEKQGITRVNFYKKQMFPDDRAPLYYHYEQKLVAGYNRDQCIILRDFLLKHFPIVTNAQPKCRSCDIKDVIISNCYDKIEVLEKELEMYKSVTKGEVSN